MMTVSSGYHKSLFFTVLAVLAMTVAGCAHKDLIMPEPNAPMGPPLTIEYIWDRQEQFRPEGMANLFFPVDADNGRYWRFDCADIGSVTYLPIGCYNVISFNNDTEHVRFSELEAFSTITLSAYPIDISDASGEGLPVSGQPIYSQPDRVWVATSDNLNVTGIGEETIKLYPRRVTREYHVEVTDIENMASVASCYVALSDLAESYVPAEDMTAGRAVTMISQMSALDSSTMWGTVVNFGLCNDVGQTRLSLYMWLADGTRKVYSFEVFEQIMSAPDPMNVVIKVKGPSLPVVTPGGGDSGNGGGGGFDVGVDDWDNVDIEL
ncbi:MAG: DUF5119 domain-containing protein [Bacteroides sp.]|nr:DUF5119 domain-containing protein [Bacteroides sp.]